MTDPNEPRPTPDPLTAMSAEIDALKGKLTEMEKKSAADLAAANKTAADLIAANKRMYAEIQRRDANAPAPVAKTADTIAYESLMKTINRKG